MRYWAYVNGEVPGSYAPEDLAKLPGFAMTTLVCPAEGEIAEKNWRRAGEFDEIARAVSLRYSEAKPAPPATAGAAAAAAASSAASEVDSLIDGASTRLFGHVAELMRELESRREEKALSLSLQRQLTALKEQLLQEKERVSLLESRAARNAELEDSLARERASLDAATLSLRERERQLTEVRAAAEKSAQELDAAQRRLTEAQNDLVVRNRLVDKLSKELSDKELSLAKSLGVIRRLEEDLNRLVPSAAPASAAPSAPESSPAPQAAASEPERALPEIPSFAKPAAPEPGALPSIEPPAGGYTTDDPPPAPPYLEPHPASLPEKAQAALLGLVRKVFPGTNH